MKSVYFFLIMMLTVSCATKEADPIKLNIDGCEYCKMKIADGKFGAELITAKGRIYKFDDMHCMVNYHKENSSVKVQSFYIHDFNQMNVLIPAETAFYAQGGEINSPMHGNIIAVKTEDEAKNMATEFKANLTSWNEIIK
ncbi:MAG TPA: nitrous oxide reductase accessory protein NosL [Flavobacterium sp.]|jgi:copper chaperone NosL|nr:nitrous oxide reductase accessory protein NosL [Flavobacterium sp.]HRZ73575.1 nitrous oxide reductase accessory protein NosL [Flavobacterium sp.]